MKKMKITFERETRHLSETKVYKDLPKEFCDKIETFIKEEWKIYSEEKINERKLKEKEEFELKAIQLGEEITLAKGTKEEIEEDFENLLSSTLKAAGFGKGTDNSKAIVVKKKPKRLRKKPKRLRK